MLEMASELQQIQEELTNQKAELLQLSSEKGELEQHLEVWFTVVKLYQIFRSFEQSKK